MTNRLSKSLWFLLIVGLLVSSAALIAESATRTDVDAALQPDTSTPAIVAEGALEISDPSTEVAGQKCEPEATLGEDSPVTLGWTPPNLSCPYRICGGGCYTDADCCGAFGGDGYCKNVPEGNNYCVCPDW